MTALDAGSTVSRAAPPPSGPTPSATCGCSAWWCRSLAFVAWGLYALTGWGVWWWIGPIVVFGVVPVSTWSPGSTAATRPTT